MGRARTGKAMNAMTTKTASSPVSALHRNNRTEENLEVQRNLKAREMTKELHSDSQCNVAVTVIAAPNHVCVAEISLRSTRQRYLGLHCTT